MMRPYGDRPTDTLQDHDEVARAVPASTLGAGLGGASLAAGLDQMARRGRPA